MAQRVVMVPPIGEILLAKRRGSKHLRLSISADGTIRVGLPQWTPYSVGIAFAKSRREWIAQHRSEHMSAALYEGAQIGKSHRLHFHAAALGNRPVSTKIHANKVEIYTHLEIDSKIVQKKTIMACERALKAEAARLLPQRLSQLARQHGYRYKDVRIKKLKSRWGSCSNAKDISLSYYLMQLPWYLIDYVLLHELAHTRQLRHGPDFWKLLESILPGSRKLRKEIEKFKPRVTDCLF